MKVAREKAFRLQYISNLSGFRFLQNHSDESGLASFSYGSVEKACLEFIEGPALTPSTSRRTSLSEGRVSGRRRATSNMATARVPCLRRAYFAEVATKADSSFRLRGTEPSAEDSPE